MRRGCSLNSVFGWLVCPDKKRVFTDPFCGVRGVDFRENLLQVFHNKLIFERDRVSVDICPLFFEYLWYFFCEFRCWWYGIMFPLQFVGVDFLKWPFEAFSGMKSRADILERFLGRELVCFNFRVGIVSLQWMSHVFDFREAVKPF